MAEPARHPDTGRYVPKPNSHAQRQLRTQASDQLPAPVTGPIASVGTDPVYLSEALAAVAEPGVHRPGGNDDA